jgi:hypothetical protein
METPRCPACGKSTVIVGQVTSGDGSANTFVPTNCRAWRLVKGVNLPYAFQACVSCGHAWTMLDPAKLRAFIEEYGEELTQQLLEDFVGGRYRGLPDTDLAREVADHVAEIDALVRSGYGAIRRYRELKGVTWDQAIKQVGGWSNLSREEKLALFGWVAKMKEKLAVDELC